jgi:hypothetical protein
MAGHGSMRPLDTASDPARQGIPGDGAGSPQAGVLGAAVDAVGSLSGSFMKGMTGPSLPGGLGEAAGGAEAAGGLAELAPLLAL